MTNLPRAAQPFVEFPTILRHHGFPVSPDQTIGFIEAIGPVSYTHLTLPTTPYV